MKLGLFGKKVYLPYRQFNIKNMSVKQQQKAIPGIWLRSAKRHVLRSAHHKNIATI
jgi:hypothetical protein